MQSIIDYCKRFDKIYIFGTGHYGKAIHSFLAGCGLSDSIAGYIVSEKKETECLGKRVFQSNDIDAAACFGVIVAISEGIREKVISDLKTKKYRDLYIASDRQLSILDQTEYTFSGVSSRKDTWINIKKMPWNSILVIKLDGIGDAVLCTPFFRELRRNNPNSRITAIVMPEVYDLLKICPYLDEIIAFEAKKYVHLPIRFIMEQCKCFMKDMFCSTRFDVTIIPRFDDDLYGAGFLSFFSGAEVVIGYSELVSERKKRLNKNYDQLYTCVLKNSIPKNEAEKNLDLLAWSGGVIRDKYAELWTTEEARQKIKTELQPELLFSKRIIILVGLAGSNDGKRWSVSNYVTVIRLLHEYDQNLFFVFLGDSFNNEEIEERLNKGDLYYSKNLAGKLSLVEIVALAHESRLYIGNDTGLMHIAACCDNYVIELNCAAEPIEDESEFGNKRFIPYMTEYEILRPTVKDVDCPDGNKMIKEIDTISCDRVFQAAKKMIDKV